MGSSIVAKGSCLFVDSDYRNRPTRKSYSIKEPGLLRTRVLKKELPRRLSSNSEFEERDYEGLPCRNSSSLALLRRASRRRRGRSPSRRRFLLSWGTFRREPATRRLDWSLAATRVSKERFARQHLFGPPPRFHRASSWTRVDRRLSGIDVRAVPRASPDSRKSDRRVPEDRWRALQIRFWFAFAVPKRN